MKKVVAGFLSLLPAGRFYRMLNVENFATKTALTLEEAEAEVKKTLSFIPNNDEYHQRWFDIYGVQNESELKAALTVRVFNQKAVSSFLKVFSATATVAFSKTGEAFKCNSLCNAETFHVEDFNYIKLTISGLPESERAEFEAALNEIKHAGVILKFVYL